MTAAPAVRALCVALTAQALLAAGLIAWSGWVAGMLLSLPLLLPLPGLLRGRARAGAWGAYLMILYVAALLAEAGAMRERHVVGLVLASLAMIAFLSLVLFVRWSARSRRAVSGTVARTGSSDDAGR